MLGSHSCGGLGLFGFSKNWAFTPPSVFKALFNNPRGRWEKSGSLSLFYKAGTSQDSSDPCLAQGHTTWRGQDGINPKNLLHPSPGSGLHPLPRASLGMGMQGKMGQREGDWDEQEFFTTMSHSKEFFTLKECTQKLSGITPTLSRRMLTLGWREGVFPRFFLPKLLRTNPS